jgi:hypothetical protein
MITITAQNRQFCSTNGAWGRSRSLPSKEQLAGRKAAAGRIAGSGHISASRWCRPPALSAVNPPSRHHPARRSRRRTSLGASSSSEETRRWLRNEQRAVADAVPKGGRAGSCRRVGCGSQTVAGRAAAYRKPTAGSGIGDRERPLTIGPRSVNVAVAKGLAGADEAPCRIPAGSGR